MAKKIQIQDLEGRIGFVSSSSEFVNPLVSYFLNPKTGVFAVSIGDGKGALYASAYAMTAAEKVSDYIQGVAQNASSPFGSEIEINELEEQLVRIVEGLNSDLFSASHNPQQPYFEGMNASLSLGAIVGNDSKGYHLLAINAGNGNNKLFQIKNKPATEAQKSSNYYGQIKPEVSAALFQTSTPSLGTFRNSSTLGDNPNPTFHAEVVVADLLDDSDILLISQNKHIKAPIPMQYTLKLIEDNGTINWEGNGKGITFNYPKSPQEFADVFSATSPVMYIRRFHPTGKSVKQKIGWGSNEKIPVAAENEVNLGARDYSRREIRSSLLPEAAEQILKAGYYSGLRVEELSAQIDGIKEGYERRIAKIEQAHKTRVTELEQSMQGLEHSCTSLEATLFTKDGIQQYRDSLSLQREALTQKETLLKSDFEERKREIESKYSDFAKSLMDIYQRLTEALTSVQEERTTTTSLIATNSRRSPSSSGDLHDVLEERRSGIGHSRRTPSPFPSAATAASIAAVSVNSTMQQMPALAGVSGLEETQEMPSTAGFLANLVKSLQQPDGQLSASSSCPQIPVSHAPFSAEDTSALIPKASYPAGAGMFHSDSPMPQSSRSASLEQSSTETRKIGLRDLEAYFRTEAEKLPAANNSGEFMFSARTHYLAAAEVVFSFSKVYEKLAETKAKLTDVRAGRDQIIVKLSNENIDLTANVSNLSAENAVLAETLNEKIGAIAGLSARVDELKLSAARICANAGSAIEETLGYLAAVASLDEPLGQVAEANEANKRAEYLLARAISVPAEYVGRFVSGVELYSQGKYGEAVEKLEIFRGKEQWNGVDSAVGIYIHALAVKKANTDADGQIESGKDEWSKWLAWKSMQLDSEVEKKLETLFPEITK